MNNKPVTDARLAGAIMRLATPGAGPRTTDLKDHTAALLEALPGTTKAGVERWRPSLVAMAIATSDGEVDAVSLAFVLGIQIGREVS